MYFILHCSFLVYITKYTYTYSRKIPLLQEGKEKKNRKIEIHYYCNNYKFGFYTFNITYPGVDM